MTNTAGGVASAVKGYRHFRELTRTIQLRTRSGRKTQTPADKKSRRVNKFYELYDLLRRDLRDGRFTDSCQSGCISIF